MNQISFFSESNLYFLEAKNFQEKSVVTAHVVKKANGHKIPLVIQMEILQNGSSKLTVQIEKI